MFDRSREGAWAWALHRISGVAVLLFLALHIVDIALTRVSAETFNALLFVYRAWPFRVLEVALVAAVVYHAVNGVRIILIDLWDRATRLQRRLFYGVLAVCFLLVAPAAFVMLRPVLLG